MLTNGIWEMVNYVTLHTEPTHMLLFIKDELSHSQLFHSKMAHLIFIVMPELLKLFEFDGLNKEAAFE